MTQIQYGDRGIWTVNFQNLEQCLYNIYIFEGCMLQILWCKYLNKVAYSKHKCNHMKDSHSNLLFCNPFYGPSFLINVMELEKKKKKGFSSMYILIHSCVPCIWYFSYKNFLYQTVCHSNHQDMDLLQFHLLLIIYSWGTFASLLLVL